jgi:hypothetical protein
MYQVISDIALRLGLGLIIGIGLLLFTTTLETIFYKNNKEIHLAVVILLLALIIYALGDIALDVLHV